MICNIFKDKYKLYNMSNINILMGNYTRCFIIYTLLFSAVYCKIRDEASHLDIETGGTEDHTSKNKLSSSKFDEIKNQFPQITQFQHKLYNVTIPENSVGKTYAKSTPNEGCLGLKIVPNLEVKFRIISGDRDKLFKTEERIIGDFAFLSLRTRTSNVILNREKTEEYRLTIRAFLSYHGINGKYLDESETIVHLRVLDRNDLSPLFYPTEYSKTIPEDMPVHKSIITVMAEDADLDINGEIYYSFSKDYDNFAVHPTSGVIMLTRSLNYLEKSFHEIIVLANDRGATSNHGLNLASKAKVTITVEPVNLHAPEIYVKMLPAIIKSSEMLLYAFVRVTDRDQGIHGEINKLEIVGGDPDGYFRITRSKNVGEFNIELRRIFDGDKLPQSYNLTLRAEDKGIPMQSSYKIVSVHVRDETENALVFNRQLYEVTVPETAPPNTPVIRLKVSEQNQSKNSLVFLEIVGGNEGGEFRINPDTGMLYTKKELDAESKSFYTLTVSAIDQENVGIRKQSSAKVKINVQDTNDNDPIFEKINKIIWINENEPAGTTVVKVTAKDKDSGENSYISYSIANLNEVPFDIDHFSGLIRTSKLIDFETMRREYILSVRASDWGLPFRRQTEMKLLIKIRDVNDNRPQFERISCVGKLLRNIPVSTEIFTLSAIDFDLGNYITYQIVSGNEDGCFNLDTTSGVLSIGCDLSDIVVPYRELNFSSTDGIHFADIMSIRIDLVREHEQQIYKITQQRNVDSNKILNDYGSIECREAGIARRQTEILAAAEKNNMPYVENNTSTDIALIPSRYGENMHTPEFIDFPIELKINESVKLGETVGWIKAKDRDLGYNGKLLFVISDGDHDSVFRMDSETGELQIIGYLDRERQDEYVLNITIFDLGIPQKVASKILPVNILDSNDNNPIFQKSCSRFYVKENVRNGTLIFRLNANDADLGDNAKVTYILLTDTDDFKIDSNGGFLYINNVLDRERNEFYELHILAKDSGKTPLSTEAIVIIHVEDVNDNRPEFILSEFVFRIREDIPLGTVVAIISATDLDLGTNKNILYSITEDGYAEIKFKIDKSTGTIRTKYYLDFEERQVHSLTVRAVDCGNPPLTSETTVIIEVIDINENRFSPEFEDFVFTGNIMENKVKGTYVMNITATDADSVGPDSKVTYSIRGGDGLGTFTIGHDGSIRSLTALDAESKAYYWLTVCAQDQGVIPLYSCVQVFISVGNENDNVPLTKDPVYYPSILEGSPAGEPILQISADDLDNDSLNQITYRIISGNPEGYFSINNTTGLITTTERKLDRENQDEHILEIYITDNGKPPLSSTTRVIISVDDINDQTPEFDQRFYKVLIPKTNEIADALFQVLAFDNDSGENGRLSYAIKSGKGKSKFRVDSSTGIIYAAKAFDSEMEYDLTVRAEDNGYQQRSSSTRVNIVVVPIPKNSLHAPIIKSVDNEVEVTESDRPGFLVTLIQSIDEDNDHLWYDIIDGDSRHEFFIGRDNGNLLLAKSLDWETQNKYNLTISVTDGVHVVTTQLFVHVIDINDHRPEFVQSIYTIDVSENVEVESNILQLHATDLDEDKKLFYTLHAARDPVSLTLFRIDSLTGNVIVTQSLDREKVAEHILIVIAKDHGTPAKRNYAKIIITVHDHNDHYPEFTSKIVQGKVYENAPIGLKIVQLWAIDCDFGENARITYSIISGNVGNMFEIDQVMGVVSLVKELNINIMPEYMLQIKASDHGDPPLSTQIPLHIIVTMAENDPPNFSSRVLSAEIYENLPFGSYVMQIEARSTSSIFYEITHNDMEEIFQINPSTGVITTKDIVDYEKKKLFNLTITARNMASASSEVFIIIHVLDENDNAPFFLRSEYCGEISESAEIGSLALHKDCANRTMPSISPLVIAASDSDAGLNAMLNYNIVEELPQKYFHIDSITGAIKILKSLDHEKTSIFNFHVLVADLGKPRLNSYFAAKVHILVSDVNDCAPIFDQTEQNVTLYLPTFENIIVLKVTANDPDSSENSILRYDIIEGNIGHVFSINSTTGIITTRNVEKIGSSYVLRIRASDGAYSAVCLVNINVEISENLGLYFQKPVYECVTPENSTKINTISLVNVLGTKLNEHVEFRILNPTNMFRIGLTSGAIETSGEIFDREICDNYKLIVEARTQYKEKGIKPRIAHAMVKVRIMDVNDNCPMFVNLPYFAVASVDDSQGSILTKVHAVDLDSFENGDVRYEMKKGNGELFKVDRKTGEVALKQSLDNHNRDYELTIAAYDGAISPCSTEISVHVKVIDKSMPIFNKQFYSFVVSENVESYSPLPISIQADSPLGRKLIYTITKGNNFETFAVDFTSGIISVVGELDYEQTKNYDLIIRATDSISGVSAEVPVAIMVQDVNDCFPEIEKDFYNISVSESTAFGTPILKVNAMDDDAGLNGQISFYIESTAGSNNVFFHMDSSEGILYLKKTLDHESEDMHYLSVVVKDSGIPSLSTISYVWIKVTDINDNVPTFNEPSYNSFLSINANRGQFVTVVKACDPDSINNNYLLYKIVEGNEHQTYDIQNTSGIITLKNMQNFAKNQVTILNVSVTDGVYTSFARVKISILPENVYNPVFVQSIYEVNVKENQLPGSHIVSVTAKDEDVGDYASLTYTIFSDHMKKYFNIDKYNGVIETKVALDREKIKLFEILVVASDGGGKSGYATVKINVDDENDNAPRFLLTEYRAAVQINQKIDESIVKVKAVDPDNGQNGLVKYSIYHTSLTSNLSDIFLINELDGSIFFKNKFTQIDRNIYQFYVRAFDGGIPELYNDVPVFIFVSNQNVETPYFEKANFKLFVSESSAPGTLIVKLQLIGNFSVKYSIISGSREFPQFSVNQDGDVSLAKTLDREEMDIHYIFVIAETEYSPVSLSFAEIILYVQDENDNAPIFENKSYDLFVGENVEKGTSLIKATAQDKDTGPNSDIRYYLADNVADIVNIFAIDMYSGWISTLVTLDKEKHDEYRFYIVASDNGEPSRIGRSNIIVKLIDYNDNPHAFKKTNYNTSIDENALPGTVLIQLSVTDEDSDCFKTPLEFFITEGDPRSQFQIRDTGELFLSKSLDREMISFYNLFIIATDGKFIAETNVTIIVNDVNDNAPICLKYRYKKRIKESSHVGTIVLRIIASDIDEGVHQKLRFYLTGNGTDDFMLDKDTGFLKVAKNIDREKYPKYFLTAHAQDREHLSWECISYIEITVTDINDNFPEFTLNEYIISVPENVEIGTFVSKVHATDRDIGINRKVIYTFIDHNIDYFKICQESGIITLAKRLDREQISMFNLSIQAEDQGTPKLFSISSLIVNVQDINDNPPEFTVGHYYVSLKENSEVTTEVIKIEATSRDSGINAEIYYSIFEGNEQKKFVIDRINGILKVNGVLDFEKTKEYFLTIQAIDGGTPPLSSLVTLNISILDINDNKPTFLQSSYHAVIGEDALIGETIIQIKAIDEDSDENGMINYNIERGDRLNQFRIDKISGYIYVLSILDRESISNYVLEVRARDNGNPELSNYVHVNINISDSNDNPPLFTKTNYSAVVQEDKQLGHVLLKFDIIDADTTLNGPPFTFDFRHGNEGRFFRLEQDGTLRTATRFHHKVLDIYKLQIRVFDNGTPPLFSDAWVNVNVIEKSQYPPVITPLEITINSYQNAFLGGFIGRIHSWDQDQYDTLFYDLSPTTGEIYFPRSLFNISSDDGSIYSLSNLDIGDYRLNVTVSDGKFVSFAIIKITVELITPDMLKNSIVIRFSKITPEEFILSHRKGFLRSIRTALRVRQKDVVIITVQQCSSDLNIISHNKFRSRETTSIETSVKHNLDVVFTVRKQQVNSVSGAYFSSAEVNATVADNINEIEVATNLVIEEIVSTKCKKGKCVHGSCKDKIILDRKAINTVSTDVISFVCSFYTYLHECRCNQGFDGFACEEQINACASDPCPIYKICWPIDEDDYKCICPNGFSGLNCDRDVRKCLNDSCYTSIKPVSFSGKSYAQYKIDKLVAKKVLEDQFIFTLRARTVQQTGNIMYASGKVDYNILEILNGFVQYKFNLGSGEGVVKVSSIYVSDGEWHEIKLERFRNRAKIIVNNKHVAQGNAPGINGILNIELNYIYIGAEVKPHPSVLGFEDIQRGFIGCMDDLKLAHESVPLQITEESYVALLKRFNNIEFSCDASTVLNQLGICGTQPCFNGGKCDDMGYGNFKCQCHPRFVGQFCQDDLDPCASSPCLFGGKCELDAFGNFSCVCPINLSGKRCEFGRFCNPNPCKNGGVCEEGDSAAYCTCRGYTGPTCEADVDECENDPCGNGATCINEDGSFRCICPSFLTGSSCGDPLYSNSITKKLKNFTIEHMIGITSGVISVLFIIIGTLCYIKCKRTARISQPQSNINNDPRKGIISHSALLHEDYKRNSKLINLEINQRPQSYTPTSNDNSYSGNTTYVNNLDILRSYGSAGDELENIPPEYQKLNCTKQHINLNANSDNEAVQKQSWLEQMQLQTFSGNKLNNERKFDHLNYQPSRLASLKPNSVISGKSLHVAVPHINTLNSFEDCASNHGQYHWDCSDWVRHSQNPLPDITEVPGVEVLDSASFHSNDSNESHAKNMANIGTVDPLRDIETLKEETDSEYNITYIYKATKKPISVLFDRQISYPRLSSIDSESEDYKFNTGDGYHRHPNSYLPSFIIPSETDGESSMVCKKLLNCLEREPHKYHHQYNNNAEQVLTLASSKRINRRQYSDRQNKNNHSASEEDLCLIHDNYPNNQSSVSDISTQLCEIEDSEFEEISPAVSEFAVKTVSPIPSKKKIVNWSTNIQQTDV